MANKTCILVTNRALLSSRIGSWTTRLNLLINRQPDFFDVILSPNTKGNKFVYCRKRKFKTWKKGIRNFQLVRWVAKDYIKEIKRISRESSSLKIVVMDDPHLVEAIALIKVKLSCEIELIYSFHGFELSLNQNVINSIDTVLFLSHLGYVKSQEKYNYFPKGIVVGNAVDSSIFFPLEKSEFKIARQKLGYSEKDIILIWMANERPKKGLHIFKEVYKEIAKNIPELKSLIIGSNTIENKPNERSIGRLLNNEVAKYLQIGDVFMFTSLYEEGFGLSVIEAYKCGNVVLGSNRGAIPEVLNDLERTFLIDDVENIDAWIACFEKVIRNINFEQSRPTRSQTDNIWNYDIWEEKFTKAIIGDA